MKKLTTEQLSDLKRLYVDENLSLAQIVKMRGVNAYTISTHLKRLGVEMRPKGGKAKLTPEQIADLKRLYVDEKLSINQIAKMMGVNVATVWQHLKRRGVETRPVETKLTPEQIADLKRLYVDEKLSTYQIAEMMGLTQARIWQRLKRIGVETRTVETKLIPEQIADLKRLYVDEKLSTYQIAEMMGVTNPTIYRHLKRIGVETRTVETKLTPEQINDLPRLYVDEKLTTYQIAKMMGVGQGTIYRNLMRLGVEMRPKGRTSPT